MLRKMGFSSQWSDAHMWRGQYPFQLLPIFHIPHWRVSTSILIFPIVPIPHFIPHLSVLILIPSLPYSPETTTTAASTSIPRGHPTGSVRRVENNTTNTSSTSPALAGENASAQRERADAKMREYTESLKNIATSQRLFSQKITALLHTTNTHHHHRSSGSSSGTHAGQAYHDHHDTERVVGEKRKASQNTERGGDDDGSEVGAKVVRGESSGAPLKERRQQLQGGGGGRLNMLLGKGALGSGFGSVGAMQENTMPSAIPVCRLFAVYI